MAPELGDRDETRFRNLRERLAGVERAADRPRTAPSPGPIDPMLATIFEGDLADVDEGEWVAERKYDGTRLVVERFDDRVACFTRRGIDRAETLAALVEAASDLPNGTILDGEYVFLTIDGASRFLPIHAGQDVVAAEGLTPAYFVFDVLAIAGEWVTRRPLAERRDLLADVVSDRDPIAVAPVRTTDFQSFYDDVVAAGEEGIVLKRRSSAYHVGTRSVHWQKVKAVTETDVVIVGFTAGEGQRSDTFGALVMTDGDRYVGRVGSGFSDVELHDIRESMTPVPGRPVSKSLVGRPYTAVEPFVVQVKYQAVTPSGELRAPVFLRVRPEKPLADVTPIERP